MKREEKTPTFLLAGPKYGLRFLKKLCTHVQMFGVDAMGKGEGQGCNANYCWQQLYSLLNSKSPLICIVGKQRKIRKLRSLNYCFIANQRVLFFEMPFLPYKGFALMGHLKTAKCEWLWAASTAKCECLRIRANCQVRMFLKQPNQAKIVKSLHDMFLLSNKVFE